MRWHNKFPALWIPAGRRARRQKDRKPDRDNDDDKAAPVFTNIYGTFTVSLSFVHPPGDKVRLVIGVEPACRVAIGFQVSPSSVSSTRAPGPRLTNGSLRTNRGSVYCFFSLANSQCPILHHRRTMKEMSIR